MMKLKLLLFIAISPSLLFAQTTNNIRFTYTKNISLRVHVLKGVAKLFIDKSNISKKIVTKKQVDDPAAIPRRYFKEFQIDTFLVDGRSVYRWSPKQKISDKTVLFIHGGGYMFNILRQHWNFVAQVIRRTNCSFIVPDYPLSPAVTYKESFVMMRLLYDSLIQEIGTEKLILMGDSAGGGFAMALCEQNNELKIAQPSQLILIAPWLDISLSNPEIKKVIKKDPLLDVESLVKIGQVWCGSIKSDNYLVSPINGDLRNLPQMSLFIGSHDILVADSRKFKLLLENQKIPFNYFEYPKLFHDWVMLVKLPEAKDALNRISDLVNLK